MDAAVFLPFHESQRLHISQLSGQRFKFYIPLRRNDRLRWKRMGLSLRESSFRRRAYAHTVQLAKHIDDEDIEYVACAILPLRSGTGMKLLRHLLIDPKTAYLVGDGQAHFRHTFNGGPHQVYLTCFAGPGCRDSASFIFHRERTRHEDVSPAAT